MLLDADGFPFTSGVLTYLDRAPEEFASDQSYIILPFQIVGFDGDLLGIVDTACPWCLMQWPLLEEVGFTSLSRRSEERFPLHTRFGRIFGSLERLTIRLPADEGEAVDVDATVFASEDWQGERMLNFLGYTGFLERLRFAVDPVRRQFHFGQP